MYYSKKQSVAKFKLIKRKKMKNIKFIDDLREYNNQNEYPTHHRFSRLTTNLNIKIFR